MTKRVYEYLLEAEEQSPDVVALEFMGQQIPFKTVAHNARVMAGGLKAQGLQAGEAIGLMLPNIPQFADVLYGAWFDDLVVVPMNVLLTGPEVRYLVEDSSIKLLVVFEMFLPAVEEAIRDMDAPPKVVVIGNAGAHIPYPRLLEAQPVEPVRNAGDAHVLTIYTSGTTGKPKGAVISNENVVTQMDMTDDLFPQVEGDRTLCVLPLFHVFALNGVLCSSFRHQGTIVLHPRFDLEAAVNSLSQDRVTIFAGVPTMYFYILQHTADTDVQFPHLRVCFSGGAAMPLETMNAFEGRFGVEIYEGYGLTETTVSICCNRPEARRPGSVGKPLPGVELQTVDDAGNPTPIGKPGEIIVRSGNVMQGYLNRPDATAETIKDGWLYTGDIGHIDEDGFVFIVDRKKDMIIKGGYNIYPREIEEVLHTLEGVVEAAVVGVDDDAKGEQVRAVISTRPGSELKEEEIEQYLSANLAKYKLPNEYVFMAELPKGPTGKILKRELR
ncbi:MAG: AMP-binding protein [Myxococcales bacterium]|nr:AMP-binding protein [Myxococcales bacterium]MDD9965887.1 AMP-binding protein [Myxococcales bacterium]